MKKEKIDPKDVVRQIVRESLAAQEAALKKVLEEEGLEMTKDVLSRVVRASFLSEKANQNGVQGMFILDQGQPTEKVLFYFREPTRKDPKVKIWFPGEIDVQIGKNAATAVRMIGSAQRQNKRFARVFFVGEHNRPGLSPLDFTTWTGNVIDQIVVGANFQTIRTNLADTDVKPVDPAPWAEEWHERNQPSEEDAVVLLGKWVQRHFDRRPGPTYFDVKHPSAFSVRKNAGAYVQEVVNLLNG